MRIGELARMAGTTARAVRHYHRAGVLPEPARSANGYRRYDVEDLVRVMRIRWLLAAGLSLREVAAVLQDDGAAGLDLAAELVGALGRVTAERERLDRQERVLRELLDQVRSTQRPSAVKQEVRRALDALADAVAPGPGSVVSTERTAVDLMVHRGVAGAEAQESLTAAYQRMNADPRLAAAVQDLDRRFQALAGVDPAAAAEEIRATAAVLEAVLTEVDVDGFLRSLEPAGLADGDGDGDGGLWLAALFPDPAHQAVLRDVISRRPT